MSEFSSYLPPVRGSQGSFGLPFDTEPQKQTRELAQALNNFAGRGPPQSILEQLQADPQRASEPSLITTFLSVADHIKQSMVEIEARPQSVKIKSALEDLHALFRVPVGAQGKTFNDVLDHPTNDNAQAYLEGLSSQQSKDWVQQMMAIKMQDMSAQLDQHITY